MDLTSPRLKVYQGAALCLTASGQDFAGMTQQLAEDFIRNHLPQNWSGTFHLEYSADGKVTTFMVNVIR